MHCQPNWVIIGFTYTVAPNELVDEFRRVLVFRSGSDSPALEIWKLFVTKIYVCVKERQALEYYLILLERCKEWRILRRWCNWPVNQQTQSNLLKFFVLLFRLMMLLLMRMILLIHFFAFSIWWNVHKTLSAVIICIFKMSIIKGFSYSISFIFWNIFNISEFLPIWSTSLDSVSLHQPVPFI